MDHVENHFKWRINGYEEYSLENDKSLIKISRTRSSD